MKGEERRRREEEAYNSKMRNRNTIVMISCNEGSSKSSHNEGDTGQSHPSPRPTVSFQILTLRHLHYRYS